MSTEHDATMEIKDRVAMHSGPGGVPLVELTHRSGSSALATPHGAHVLSWKTAAGTEQLFMSPRALFAPEKAIRGGVPIIFPQFGPGALPTHGFGRIRQWHLVKSAEDQNGIVSVTFALENSPDTFKLWPHQFRAEMTVALSDSLRFELLLSNRGSAPLSFQCAFHTYFAISDISSIRVRGLANVDYLDNLQGRRRERGSDADLTVDREIDRVYVDAPNPTVLKDSGGEIEITKHGLSDVVAWNPWIEKSKTLTDLEPESYRKFICLETGRVGTPVVVAPGQSYACGQSLRAIAP